MRTRSKAWVVAVSAGAILGWSLQGCATDCGCGANTDDPVAAHDASYAGEHTLDDGCACRCDDGPLEHWPYDDDGTCEHEQTHCETEHGEYSLSCS